MNRPLIFLSLGLSAVLAGAIVSRACRAPAPAAEGAIPPPTPEPTILPQWSRLVNVNGVDWTASVVQMPDGSRLLHLTRGWLAGAASPDSWIVLPPAPRTAKGKP
jgi:hypothetical protein